MKDIPNVSKSDNELITYFRFNGSVVNGWKIVNCGELYNLYTYTSCNKFGGWQLFFNNYSYQKLLTYFVNMLNDLNTQMKSSANPTDWLKENIKWIKATIANFKKFEVCEWTEYDYKTIRSPHDRAWSIPSMKDFIYCPHCGKKIKIIK